MNVVSLCSGVGLIDLGLEWAGFRTVQVCEIDEWCRSILRQRFPDAAVHDDAWTIQPEPCDLVAAGFPCQPVSVAGRRAGQDDDRWLWPAVERAIRLARPRYVLLENVPGIASLGLGDVLRGLAVLGFNAEWTVFGAWQTGALHRRDRWWLVATSDPDVIRVWDESGGFFRAGWASSAVAWAHGPARPVADTAGEPGRADAAGGVNGHGHRPGWEETDRRSVSRGEAEHVADADEDRRCEGVGVPSGRRVAWPGHLVGTGAEPDVGDADARGRAGWTGLPDQAERCATPESGRRELEPGLGGVAHGLPGGVDGPRRDVPLPARWLDGTWEDGVPRVTTVTDHRARRLSALGNGVVPQCVELIGLRIQQLDAGVVR